MQPKRTAAANCLLEDILSKRQLPAEEVLPYSRSAAADGADQLSVLQTSTAQWDVKICFGDDFNAVTQCSCSEEPALAATGCMQLCLDGGRLLEQAMACCMQRERRLQIILEQEAPVLLHQQLRHSDPLQPLSGSHIGRMRD